MSQKLKKIIFIFGSVLFILLLGEVIYFHYILSQREELKKADLIAVFAGSPERIEIGYKFAKLGYAPYLVISPASVEQINSYNSKYDVASTFQHIVENNARNTFENALYVAQIINDRNLKSAIVVTSWHHMPRSYFLIKMLLFGKDVHIQISNASEDKWKQVGWFTSSVGINAIFHELIDFWGSGIQLTGYFIRNMA